MVRRAHPVQLLFAAVAIAGLLSIWPSMPMVVEMWGVKGKWMDVPEPSPYVPTSASDPWYAEHGWLEV